MSYFSYRYDHDFKTYLIQPEIIYITSYLGIFSSVPLFLPNVYVYFLSEIIYILALESMNSFTLKEGNGHS